MQYSTMIVVLGVMILSVAVFATNADGAGLVWRAINKSGSSLFDIANVAFTNCSNGQVLQWQTSNSTWICATSTTGKTETNSINGGTARLLKSNSTTEDVFKSLTQGSGISITNGTDTVTIASSVTQGYTKINNVDTTGGTASILATNVTATSTQATFKTITPGTGITITNGTKTVTINANLPAWLESATRKTADYTATTSDGTVIVDTRISNRTITLPTAASASGQIITITRNDTQFSRNWLMIDASGTEKIENSLNLNITVNGGSAILQSNGTSWSVLNKQEQGPAIYGYSVTRGTTANRWVVPQAVTNTALATLLAQTAAIQAYPFILPYTTTFDRAEIDVSTLSAGTTCRVGIYTSDHNGLPFKLVSGTDVGTISGAATGRVGNSFTTPVTLQPGLYYTAVQCSTAATLTLRAVPVAAQANILGYSSGAAPTTTAGFTWTRAYAAFPTNYGPATAYLGAVSQHAVFLRAVG